MALWEPLGGLQRSGNGSYPVNMSQLDHLVVFGTKSVPVQDFQRGKKCLRGFKQTPLDPLKHPQTPLKTPANPPKPNH